jgi:hypothetical protein
MRGVVDGVHEHLGAGRMRERRDCGDVDDAARGVRRQRAGNEPRPGSHQGREIGRMQPAIVAHAPPDDFRTGALERQPGRHVRLVVEFADDDLRSRRSDRLTDGETDRADERRRVQPERDLVCAARVHECRDAFARSRDHRVDLARSFVRPAALDVS